MKKIQVPNYSRQVLKYLLGATNSRTLGKGLAPFAPDIIEVLPAAEKFLLPPNGAFLFDPDYRSIDENKTLRLPFPSITLEYETDPEAILNDPTYSDEARKNPPRHTKTVILADEITQDGKPQIVVFGFAYYPAGNWVFSPPVILDADCYIERNPDGSVANLTHGALDHPDFRPSEENAVALAYILISFLNVLACSNVETTRVPAQKQPSKKKKNALPFSDYHILTVGKPRKAGDDRDDSGEHGTHRSPREHLRRGHIRRCASGVCTWVNACVVGAGTGGRITKDYDMRGEPNENV